jgi:nucleotidyltransferase substrate binding protein (TIGR01987 family)
MRQPAPSAQGCWKRIEHMSSSTDIRWKQRFANYRKALARLTEALVLQKQRPLSDLERQGLIKAFEFTHELAWNTLKDYAEFKGIMGLIGSRDATRTAFKIGLIEDGENWMAMIKSRNETSHAYDESKARAIEAMAVNHYGELFRQLESTLMERIDET